MIAGKREHHGWSKRSVVPSLVRDRLWVTGRPRLELSLAGRSDGVLAGEPINVRTASASEK